MRIRLLVLMSLWGILTFVGPVAAQETTTAVNSTAHEALLIPLLHSNPNSFGSSVFWSPDSHYIVVSDTDFSLTEAVVPGLKYGVFDVFTGQFLFDIPGFVDWLPDSKHIVSRDGETTDAQIMGHTGNVSR